MTKPNEKKNTLYVLNIEDREYPWDSETITPEQIAELGGWDPAQGVIEVDKDNNETTLEPGKPVTIKPGHGFGKKHRWKRGRIRDRIQQELNLLRQHYPDIEHQQKDGEDWFLIPSYSFPPGWRIDNVLIERAPVVFKAGAAYPTGEPYGFCTPAGINFKGSPPKNTGSPVTPPFSGAWQHFSWAPDGGWAPSAEVTTGQNLLIWVRSFARRLQEGA